MTRFLIVLGMGAVLLGAAPILPIAQASSAVLLAGQDTDQGRTPMAPMAATTTVAFAGSCVASETASVPFGPGSSRGNSSVVEPSTCASGTLLDFSDALLFANGLPTPAGHVLDARLDLLQMSGTTSMLGNVSLNLTAFGGGTGTTSIQILSGSITSSSTSSLTLAPPLAAYGIHLAMNLTLPAIVSTATLNFLLTVYVDDGGIVSTVDFESVTFIIQY